MDLWRVAPFPVLRHCEPWGPTIVIWMVEEGIFVNVELLASMRKERSQGPAAWSSHLNSSLDLIFPA